MVVYPPAPATVVVQVSPVSIESLHRLPPPHPLLQSYCVCYNTPPPPPAGISIFFFLFSVRIVYVLSRGSTCFLSYSLGMELMSFSNSLANALFKTKSKIPLYTVHSPLLCKSLHCWTEHLPSQYLWLYGTASKFLIAAHRLNMEVDLQNLFGLNVTWCAQLYSLAETPQPPALGLVDEGAIGQQR
jgi:hypothetical protein